MFSRGREMRRGETGEKPDSKAFIGSCWASKFWTTWWSDNTQKLLFSLHFFPFLSSSEKRHIQVMWYHISCDIWEERKKLHLLLKLPTTESLKSRHKTETKGGDIKKWKLTKIIYRLLRVKMCAFFFLDDNKQLAKSNKIQTIIRSILHWTCNFYSRLVFFCQQEKLSQQEIEGKWNCGITLRIAVNTQINFIEIKKEKRVGKDLV